MTGAIEQEQYENERWLAVTDWMASRPAALDRPLLSASAFAAGADWFKARAAVEAAKPAPEPFVEPGLLTESADSVVARVEAAKPAPEAPSYELSSKETGALNRALLRSVKFKPAPEAVEPLRAALAELVACKDLKDAANALNTSGSPSATVSRRHMLAHYERRKGPAWSAARSALLTFEAGALTDEPPQSVEPAWFGYPRRPRFCRIKSNGEVTLSEHDMELKTGDELFERYVYRSPASETNPGIDKP